VRFCGKRESILTLFSIYEMRRTIKGLKSMGPYEQRSGAWARRLNEGSAMRLRLDPRRDERRGAPHD